MLTEVSAGGVLFHDHELLLLRKPNAEWVMPKGHLEPGESPEQAAVREVFEETGLHAQILGKVGNTQYQFRLASGEIRQKIVHWFLMVTQDRQLKLEPTFTDGIFMPVEKGLRTLTFENDREIVRKALARQRRPEEGRGAVRKVPRSQGAGQSGRRRNGTE